MENKPKKSRHDKPTPDRPFATAASPHWRELLLRLFRHGRRFLFPVRPSSQIGIGAIPNGQGVTFRVWAPNAAHVQVTGSFNRWSQERHPLASEGNGYWSAGVTTAKPGDEYKLVIQNGSTQLIRTDPFARDVVAENGNGVICRTAGRTQGSPPAWMPKWNELVIYELHVGTFAASAHDAQGQFRGVIEKLPYLQELGINAIELMPIAEFAGEYSWGYNPAHPFAVTRTYGGREAFRELVDAAHDHGLAVIVDVVYNHFGPEDLSLWQFDGWQENGKGGIYFYNDWRSTTPWADTRPDYGRTEVRQYIRDYNTNNVAKKVIEFSIAIPRARLKPNYGDGFQGAPLRIISIRESTDKRNRGVKGDGSRAKKEENTESEANV